MGRVNKMKYEIKLVPMGFDVIDTETGNTLNAKPLSSKSKAKALIKTLTDKKNPIKESKSSWSKKLLGRDIDWKVEI